MNKLLLSSLAFVLVGCLSSHLPAISTADLPRDVRGQLERDIQPECWHKSGANQYQLSSALYECKREAQYSSLISESEIPNVQARFRQCMTTRGWAFQQQCSKRTG